MLTHFEPQEFDTERARQAVLETLLTIHAYSRRTGELPEDLEDLVRAGLMTAVPMDPQSLSGETLHYRKDAQSFSLWGNGADGVDDGGMVSDVDGTKDVGFKVPITSP